MNLTYREIGEQYRSMAQSKEYLDGEIQNISSNKQFQGKEKVCSQICP